MGIRNADFEQQVVVPLERQCRRLRRYRLIEGLCLVSAILVGLCAFQLAVDYLLRLRTDTRAILLIGMVVVVGLAAWRLVIRPLRIRFGVMDLANELEKRFGPANSLLVSAMQFHAGCVGTEAVNSPQLQAAVINRAARQAKRMPFDALINTPYARRYGWGITAIVAVVVACLCVAPATLGTWFDRNILLADVSWPRRTLLIVQTDADGVIRAAIGDDVEIRATVDPQYEVPRQVDVVFVTASGKQGREAMTGVGERGFRASFARAREGLRFQLRGGDDITRWYEVRLSERPRVDRAVLTVHPPAYTRRPVVTLPEGQRVAQMYAGSTLELAITCNKPVVKARLMSDGSAVADATPAADGGFLATVMPSESSNYHFDLLDADGLRNVRPMRISARIIPDHAPKVRINLPDVGNLVTLDAVLETEAEFSDDLGLADAAALYRVSDGDAVAMDVGGFEPGRRMFSARFDWPVAAAGADVGAQVAIFARARDFDDVNGPNVRESAAVTFRIATAEELQADFARREQEYRRQFQRAMQSQERIRRDLLSLLARIAEAQTRKDLELLLAPIERRQRQLNAQVNLIRRQFEQLVHQMHINRLETPETRTRLVDGIITPMSQLSVTVLTDAADLLRRLARERTEALAATVDPLQAQILTRMQLILDNMLKWEGYQETVNMLREILTMQRELSEETQQQIERSGSDVFDD